MGTLLLAIHDVAPATIERTAELRRRAAGWGVERATLLAVPDYHGQGPLERSPEAVAFLRRRAAAGDEIALHGHRHAEPRPPRWIAARLRARAGSAGEAECLAQTSAERDAMLFGARLGLEAAVGAPIGGFVAPAWLEPRRVGAALREAGFTWHETALWIEELRLGRRVRSPIIGLATRSRSRRAASSVWLELFGPVMVMRAERGLSPLRVALHPADLDCPPLVAALGTLVRSAADRMPCVTMMTYLEGGRAAAPGRAAGPGG